MGKELSEQFPLARRVFAEAEDSLGFALSQLCFSGPEADLKLTENTQPAILTASIAALRVLEAETALRPTLSPVIASASTARWCAVGALNFCDAVKVVRERGRLMQQAVPAGSGAMAVILGLEMDAVRSALRRCQPRRSGCAGQL